MESGSQTCTLQNATDQTCEGHALQCLQNLTNSHDPTPGLVEKWSGNQVHSRKAAIAAVVCAAVVTTLIMAVLAWPTGGLAAEDVAGNGLSRELPSVLSRWSRAQTAPQVLEVKFLGLDEQ